MMFIQYIYLFRRIMATICCLFGLPGNILTIIVCIKALFHRTINFEGKVFDLYLAEISILDTCLLLYWVIEIFCRYLYKSEYFSLMHISAFSCFFVYMINRLFAALCSWLITCFTLIRFLNIFRRLNTIRSNIILVTCLTIIFSIANSYLLITLKYDRGEKSQVNENVSIGVNQYFYNSALCYISDEYVDNKLILYINTFVAGFLNLALPSMLTLIVNIAIVYYIKRVYNKQNCEPLQRRSDAPGASYRSTRSTLLVISITYTLCYLPYCIIYLLLITFGDANRTLLYWSEIAFILRYISHSINFYAYIFTNQRFRRDIIVLLRNIYRPSLYLKERNRQRKKNKHTNTALQQHRLTLATLPNNPARKLICNNQQPPTPCIRLQDQNDPERQQNLLTAEHYQNKPKTLLASMTPSASFDKLIIGANV